MAHKQILFRSAEVLRLRGRGLAVFGCGRGDLNLRVRGHIPEDASGQERELYSQLRAAKAGPRRMR